MAGACVTIGIGAVIATFASPSTAAISITIAVLAFLAAIIAGLVYCCSGKKVGDNSRTTLSVPRAL